MRPWKVAIGVTVALTAVTGFVVWSVVPYLHRFTWVLVVDYGAYLAAYGFLGMVTVAAGVYSAARMVSLGAVGRKVDVVERSIRRGAGQDAALAAALARDEAGSYGP